MMRTIIAVLLFTLAPLKLAAQPAAIRLTLTEAISRGFETATG